MGLCLTACAGARHRKVSGPPPEYEHPDDPSALQPTDGGLGGQPREVDAAPYPLSRLREWDGGAGSDAEFMLISPDGRR